MDRLRQAVRLVPCLITICLFLTMIGCGPVRFEEEPLVASADLTSSTEAVPISAAEPNADLQDVESAANQHASFYTVATYDEASKPIEDLAETVAQAQKEHKRVILQIGGDWCGWCALISEYMTTNEVVRKHLDDHFLMMKVTYPGENAEPFLAAYPKCNAYPHFFVLEEDGTFLHSQGTGELEEGKGYNQEKFMAFLQQWTP